MEAADEVGVLSGQIAERTVGERHDRGVGIAVVGVGDDRIETEPAFRANFESLDVSLAASGVGLANAIVAVKQGEKQAPWEIDGITGATISSKAIANILRRSTEVWVPRIAPRVDAFATGGAHDGD